MDGILWCTVKICVCVYMCVYMCVLVCVLSAYKCVSFSVFMYFCISFLNKNVKSVIYIIYIST